MVDILVKAVVDAGVAGDVPFALAVHIRLASLTLDSGTLLDVDRGSCRR
jgi:hypothetical protein